MSIKDKILAKRDLGATKLARDTSGKYLVHRVLYSRKVGGPDYPPQGILKIMGNGNSRGISNAQSSDIVRLNVKAQRMRNGQLEVYKKSWRAGRVALNPERASRIAELNMGVERPEIPKRGTYIKEKRKQLKVKLSTSESEKENETTSPTSNADSSMVSSLPSRSDILPPDGGSLRSDPEKSKSPTEVTTICNNCAEAHFKLSKAYAERVSVTTSLQEANEELCELRAKVNELEQEHSKSVEETEEALSSLRELEKEMCDLQRDKALLMHELNITKRQLAKVLDLSEVSDCSNVSSVFVSGSSITEEKSEESGNEADLERQDIDKWKIIQEQLDKANGELDKLRHVDARNAELELAIKECEERIGKLQEELKKVCIERKESSTQTLRRDGTFTRQPPDKTKIPKRLINHHCSLPVISDLPKQEGIRIKTGSLSKIEMLQKNIKTKEKEITNLKNMISKLEKQIKVPDESLQSIQSLNYEDLMAENGRLQEELRIITENYKKEMVLRKKFFNIAEELKGKIRVYCRVKPRDSPVKNPIIDVPDEYTILLSLSKGRYEFTFDSIFMPSHSQEDVFQNVQPLIQSAVDGYNVCIFAYGQTGSGKTYTLVGTEMQPGIGPRAFGRIFQLVRENQSELNFRITASVFELYNDNLIDLLKIENEDKLKIRKDHHGIVYVQGSESREVKSEEQMQQIFQEACSNRHVSCTKMNTESSRSHLIVTILIESTNKITGTILRGKLSIVDLAGSERVGKSAAVANQLKEANSINKSLSALGDVVAALSSHQQYVPYRNNKLTLLMQDSLGSNAKTLMFVTISSSELNAEESLNSLVYASRVKQVTNSASRMAESKEIAKLRAIILKLSKDGKTNGHL